METQIREYLVACKRSRVDAAETWRARVLWRVEAPRGEISHTRILLHAVEECDLLHRAPLCGDLFFFFCIISSASSLDPHITREDFVARSPHERGCCVVPHVIPGTLYD